MNSQTQGAYANEMDPTQTSTPPAGQPYTTTETITTTHTARTPQHSTAAAPMGTLGGVDGGQHTTSGRGILHGVKEGLATLQGGLEKGRGKFNEGIDTMGGDVSPLHLNSYHKRRHIDN